MLKRCRIESERMETLISCFVLMEVFLFISCLNAASYPNSGIFALCHTRKSVFLMEPLYSSIFLLSPPTTPKNLLPTGGRKWRLQNFPIFMSFPSFTVSYLPKWRNPLYRSQPTLWWCIRPSLPLPLLPSISRFLSFNFWYKMKLHPKMTVS